MINPKELPPQLRLKYIVDAMAMRARDKASIKAAALKRASRASKRAVLATLTTKTRTHMGLVDDDDYEPFMTFSSVPALKTSEGRTSYNPQVGV